MDFYSKLQQVVVRRWSEELADKLHVFLQQSESARAGEFAYEELSSLLVREEAIKRIDFSIAVEPDLLSEMATKKAWSIEVAIWLAVMCDPPKRHNLLENELELVEMWETHAGEFLFTLQDTDPEYNEDWIIWPARVAIWFLRHNGQPPTWYKN